MRKSFFFATSAAVISLATSTAVRAQVTANSVEAEAEAPQGLEEIIVTAQKREQNLQDVPVAVSAIGGSDLENRNITQFSNLSAVAPSLTITESNDIGSSSINLRGIGTFAFSPGVEPAVAVIIDDIPILQQAQAFTGLSDIDRIEVLRGPQGTLFGKGASAGLINIVTRAPTNTFTGRVLATATTDEEYRIEGGISGPLGDNAGFRLNGFYGDREGYIRNLTNGTKLSGEESWGIRGRLNFDVSDALSLSLLALHTENESNGNPATYRVLPARAVGFRQLPFAPGTPLAPTAAGLTPGPGNYAIRLSTNPLNKQKQTTISGRAELDLGAAQLISITSYQDWKSTLLADVDNTDIPFFGPNGVIQGGPLDISLFTQELRLVSTGSGPFQYLAGLYYADGNTDRAFSRTPAGPLRSENRSENGTRTYAAFAQGTFDITDTTHLDIGGRFNREEIDVSFIRLLPGACQAGCSSKAQDDQVTYKVSLRQDLSDDIMAYGSFATGYKGQAFDITSSFTQAAADSPVAPEKSKAYELGLKSRFLDNRVQLNIAAFWTDYNDFQAQSAQVQPDQSIIFRLNNVGKLRTKGVEVELTAKPFDGFTIGANAAYVDAKVRSFPLANCYTGQTAAQGCFDIDGAGPRTDTAQDLAGSQLANSPKFKYNISANYETTLPGTAIDGFVGIDWRHQSSVNFDLSGNPAYAYGSYGVFNANLGIKQSGGGGYRVTLFVNNAFDKNYVGTLNTQAGGTTQPTGVPLVVNQVLPRDSRRYFGLRIGYDF